MASAAADPINNGLMRIALGDRNLDRVRRLRLRQGREVNQAADHDDEQDDEHQQTRHAGAFAERWSRCIAL